MNTELSSIIDETKRLLGAVRGSLIRVAMNLSQLRATFAAKGEWGRFCESELGISEGFASKLLTVQRVYIEEGGLKPEQLEGIDHERLYLAAKIEGSPELKLETARTLTRSELKTEKNEALPHKGEYRSVCTVCWIAEENHP